jgi:DNA sulfur modification protein DndD
LSESANSYIETIRADYLAWKHHLNELDLKRSELRNVEIEINSLGSDDITKLNVDYKDFQNSLKEKNTLLTSLSQKRGNLEKDIISAEREIEQQLLATAKNKNTLLCIAYTEELYNYFIHAYNEREEQVKKDLLESVNRIFPKMYRGHRTVTLDDNYHITLITQLGTQEYNLDESLGLETVKNFAFMAGLVEVARKKMSRSAPLDEKEETEAFPLVMDAPFSHADDVHINKISKVLPDIAEQVILIVMQKDWEFAKTALESKIGKRYTIEIINDSEIYSVVREGE